MNEVDRGFKGILLACSCDPDPIFFDCPPRCFQNSDMSYTIYEIKNGYLKTEKTYIPIDPPSINNEKYVEIEDRVVSGSFDESMTSQLLYINDHISQLVANYFNTIVVRLKLIFGINEDVINKNNNADEGSINEEEEDENSIFVLLDGSTVITLESQTNTQIARPEIRTLVEKVLQSNNSNIQETNQETAQIIIDKNKKSKKHLHKKSYYASDSLSFTEKENSEEDQTDDYMHNEQSVSESVHYCNPDSQIIYAIDYELNRQIDYTHCITNSPQCGPIKYQIKRIVVALYNLHSLFPNYGDSELYYQIKLKAPHLTEKVPCCVQCYHLYLAAERVCRACKQSYPLTFDLPPQPFQPLVATELNKRGKMPLNSTTLQKNEPHSFILNIINSPYKDPAFIIPEPKGIVSGKRKNSAINARNRNSYSSSRCSTSYSSTKRESTPSWVSRLAGDDSDASSFLNSRSGMRNLYNSSISKYRAANANDLPYYLTPIGYSETLAPDNYYRPPFDIAKIDPKRKRKLHVQKKKKNYS